MTPGSGRKRPDEAKRGKHMTVSTSPLISVVSPFYNRAHHLPALLATLEAQTFRDFELVISDDGSTDELVDAVERSRTSFPTSCVRHQVNRGAAAARNTGMDVARGRYIALLDSDDGWRPDKLQKQLQHVTSHQEASRLVSLTRQIVIGASTYLAPNKTMNLADEVGSYLFLSGGVIQSSMMFLRRDLATSVRFDNESKGHDDWSFALRLQAAGARFEMLNEPLTIYNDNTGGARRSPSYSATRLQWLAERKQNLGNKAYWAAVAAVASRLEDNAEIKPLRLIANACGRGAISPWRAAYYALSWAMPSIRSIAVGARKVAAGRELARLSCSGNQQPDEVAGRRNE